MTTLLNASFADISSCLSTEEQIDVLLYALRLVHIHPDSYSQTVIENAVQSCIDASTRTAHLVQARILRAKTRLASGMSLSAREDLEAALSIDPQNKEASTLLRQHLLDQNEQASPPSHTGSHETFPSEVWREIATYLTRRDQRALLFVPYVPSRVASQLLFRRIDLRFGDTASSQQARRNADILTRIVGDPSFACLVKHIRICFDYPFDACISFQAGVLANAVPYLINLHAVSFEAAGSHLTSLVDAFRPASQQLRAFVISWCDDEFDFETCSEINYLTDLWVPEMSTTNATAISDFMARNRQTLNTLVLDNSNGVFPANVLSIENLTSLEFAGRFDDVQPFCDIFSQGHRLKNLNIRCVLNCNPSSQLKTLRSCLPCLEHFFFLIRGLDPLCNDPDLFPTLAELLRNRKCLSSLRLSVFRPVEQARVGFDASTWGLLNTLTNLVSLGMTYPQDLPPVLASWLIPRRVRALTLDILPTLPWEGLFTSMRAGLPPDLRYLYMTGPGPLGKIDINGFFPTLRVLRIDWTFWTVARTADGTVEDVRLWSWEFVERHTREWLAEYGCEDALPGLSRGHGLGKMSTPR